MSLFTHRWVRESDIPAIYTIWREKAIQEQVGERFTLTESSFKDAFFRYKNSEMRLSYKEEILVGFCAFSLTMRNFQLFDKPGLFIHCFGVVGSSDPSTVYPALMADMKKIAIERGCGRIDTVILKTNEAGLKFCQTAQDIKEVDYIHTFRVTI